jgi:aspartate/methionine/tyrosine aminotransferase
MSGPLVSSRLADIPFAGIRKEFEKAARLEAQGRKVIHFEIGRPDFDTPGHIKEAAKGARTAVQDRGDLPQRVSLAFEHGEYVPFLYV